MPRLIALKPLRYAGQSMVRGQAFKAKEKDARILVGIKKAEYAPDPAPATVRTSEPPRRPQPLVTPEPAADPAPTEPPAKEEAELPSQPPAAPPTDDLDAMRAADLKTIAAEAHIPNWSRKTKQELIESIRTYRRRDMRAEG